MRSRATRARRRPGPPGSGRHGGIPEALARALEHAVGATHVITDPGRLLAYESDALTAYRRTPGAVVLPADTEEAVAVTKLLGEAGVPVVPRGAGTGLSGGALAGPGTVAVGTARMNRILDLKPADRLARVQAGLVNARLTAAARPHGLKYAPDPSSQSACTLGGNVAENSGGPHCLRDGVTSRYVSGLTVVLARGEVMELGGASREPTGFDLTGVTVGSEGCFGLVTEVELRLVAVEDDVRTLLAIFDRIEDAARAVTGIVASGLLPAAVEIIDGETIRAVEASIFAAGYPVDAGAALVVELDGTGAGLDGQAEIVAERCRREGAREVRRARSEEEREALWKGRKKAFGAMGRIAPDLMVQDATVPRSRLPDVLARIRRIGEEHDLRVANVFHAGDGNLHPNIGFDRRNADEVERVGRASREIMRVCVEAGGTITGEHGVGIDKRDYMRLVHGDDELAAMAAVKAAFDPEGLLNPGKVLPDGVEPSSSLPRGPVRGPSGSVRSARAAGLIRRVLGEDALADGPTPGAGRGEEGAPVALPASTEEAALLLRAASDEGLRVLPAGRATWLRGGGRTANVDLVVSTRRMDRVEEHEPDDLTLTAGAGISLASLGDVAGAHGQWLPVRPPGDPDGTLGATVATASESLLRTRYGAVRDLVLGTTLVTGDGRVLRLGGRVVKNVAGFDLTRLVVGSWGTLGLVTSVTVKLLPRPPAVAHLRARAERLEELVAAARAVAESPVAPASVELREEPEEGASGGPAVLDVVLHGPREALDAEADALREAAPELAELDRALPTPEVAGTPDLVVRLRLRRSELGDLVGLSRGLGRLEGGRDALRDAAVLRRVDVLDGSARVVVRNVRTDGPWAERWGRRLADLRGTATRRGGGLSVEAAPVPIVRAVVPHTPPGTTEARVMRRIRDAFDPAGALAPGPYRLERSGGAGEGSGEVEEAE